MELKHADEVGGQVPWNVLDATKSIEDLSEEIRKISDNIIESVREKEINLLWI